MVIPIAVNTHSKIKWSRKKTLPEYYVHVINRLIVPAMYLFILRLSQKLAIIRRQQLDPILTFRVTSDASMVYDMAESGRGNPFAITIIMIRLLT